MSKIVWTDEYEIALTLEDLSLAAAKSKGRWLVEDNMPSSVTGTGSTLPEALVDYIEKLRSEARKADTLIAAIRRIKEELA